MIVLNNYTSGHLSMFGGLDDQPEEARETAPIDRVTVSCQMSKLSVIVCDLSDLYDDPHYVVAHRLKVITDLDVKLILAFPLIDKSGVPTEGIQITSAITLSPIHVLLDVATLRHLLTTVDTLIAPKPIHYEQDVVNQLKELPSAGFFSVPSHSQRSGQDPSSSIVSLLKTYFQDEPMHLQESRRSLSVSSR